MGVSRTYAEKSTDMYAMGFLAENKWGIGLMLIGAGLAVFVGKVLGAICILVGFTVLLIPSRIRTHRLSKLSPEEKKARVDALDRSQKQFLKTMIEANRRTIQVDSTNALIRSLILADFLMLTSRRAPVYKLPAMITDWAWGYLREHPGSLK